MSYKPEILIIDDDSSYRDFLVESLSEVGYRISGISDYREAFPLITENNYSTILLAGNNDSADTLQVIQRIKKEFPSIQLIILSKRADVKTAFHAIRLGAYDFLSKSQNIEEFIPIIDLACRKAGKQNVKSRSPASKSRGNHGFPIIGNSSQIKSILKLAQKVAPTDSTVLVLGETGVGKELVARTIHYNSFRKEGPFVVLNCGAIPDSLIESELFGHEKGAFTDAVSFKKGLLEEADRGTIFLDEISEISPLVQIKLLRAVETSRFRRLGSNKEIQFNARIISATNRKLFEEVKEGRFRADLYYRLAVIDINVPPLRERKEDIPILVDHFIKKCSNKILRIRNASKRHGSRQKKISLSAMKFLAEYDWPGNIRELKNIMERLIILSDNEIITPYDLAQVMTGLDTWESITRELESKGTASLEEMEREHIGNVLKRTNGNHERASKILGISPRTLHAKMKRYGRDIKVSKMR